MGAHSNQPFVGGGDGQAFVNPLIAAGTLSEDAAGVKSSDIEAAHPPTPSTSPRSSHHAPSAHLAALVVLAHAAAFWGLFLGVHGRQDPTAAAAAALAYEAAAGLTFLLLAGLWVWSRVAVKTGAASAPQALSIPALAALFGLQWAAFSYLFLSACCA